MDFPDCEQSLLCRPRGRRDKRVVAQCVGIVLVFVATGDPDAFAVWEQEIVPAVSKIVVPGRS